MLSSHTHTHTQNYSAYVRKFIVIDINIIGVVTVKDFGGQELGVVGL